MVVPDSIRLLLHDYAVPAEPEGPVWERAVMERVMERGGWDDMRWLVAELGRARLGAEKAVRCLARVPPSPSTTPR